ncbi:2OG-Fe(II) oxygenase [Simiduia agarivorans]|uniref:2OG-Fe(II) oxygenase n=1 Tax=Simiduia agarivorans (strain DSM 21679 / JCM 13881 / BCRC 17597 / SA1) TaxID=1117647 RepID=K4KQR9_SIMAS|nr:2OG-Fe(II) oxygenase [Simiduia agarivorans]AFV00611.1 2OG-Fe(II) oxygenase [Simiduia agarivorans SA1 = DSM 21679]
MLELKKDELVSARNSFDNHGWAVLENVFQNDFAERVFACANEQVGWNLVTRIEGQHRAFDASAMTSVPEQNLKQFESLVAAEAQAGFQYIYERIPLYDQFIAGTVQEPVMQALMTCTRSAPFIESLKQVTGDSSIRFTDGQFTRYRRGHYLTRHDDRNDANDRVAAFVINFSKAWHQDMGGWLALYQNESVEKVMVPRFNSMVVFKVPRDHAVTPVAPWVDGCRYALTGWARRGEE